MAVPTVSAEKLLEVGAHFGHQSRRWNPKMDEYLYAVKGGVHIFDLVNTKKLFDEALEVLYKNAKTGNSILLVGTKKQAAVKVKKMGEELGLHFVSSRWLGGTLTNFEQMKKSVKRLKEMKEKVKAGEYEHLTKKEQLLIDREIDKLEKKFGGVSEMEKLPDLLVVIDTKREVGAVKEADQLNIPVIGIVDSNADPEFVTHPIPMNDDATQVVDYALSLFRETIEDAKGSAKKKKTKKSKKKTESKEKKQDKKSKKKTGNKKESKTKKTKKKK